MEELRLFESFVNEGENVTHGKCEAGERRWIRCKVSILNVTLSFPRAAICILLLQVI